MSTENDPRSETDRSSGAGAGTGAETGAGDRAGSSTALGRGSLLGAGLVLAAALLVLVNYVGWKYHARLDWTETRLYSLSETTEQVLDELDAAGEPVRVTALLSAASPVYEPARELLERYRAASSVIELRLVDPERNPLEAQRLVEELEVAAGGVIFERGGERRVVPEADMAEVDYGAFQRGEAPGIGAFRGEERFTSALVGLSQGERPTVRFTVGHGEMALDDLQAGGLAGLEELLGRDNVSIDEWASRGAEAVPPDTDLVVVAGPQAPFTEAEVAALDAYLGGGGRLLMLLDPVFAPGGVEAGFADLGLAPFLASWGVELGEAVLVDPREAVPGFSPETFFALPASPHPVSASLDQGGIAVLVRQARPVAASLDPPPGLTVEEVLTTSPDAWALSDLTNLERDGPVEEEARGPLSLGVVVEGTAVDDPLEGDDPVPGATDGDATSETGTPGTANAPRLVVLGDADLAATGLLLSGPGNAILASSSLNWLLARESLVGIPPKRPEQVRLSMTPGQLRNAVLLVTLGLPALAIVAGVWVGLRRRRTA